MESLFLIGTVIAATELLKQLRDRNYWSAATIVAAAVIGALVGYLGIDSLTVTDGIMGGLAAAGVITTARAIRPVGSEVTVGNVEQANVNTAPVEGFEPTTDTTTR